MFAQSNDIQKRLYKQDKSRCLKDVHVTIKIITITLGALLCFKQSYAQLNMGITEGEDQVSVTRLRSSLWAHTGVSMGSLNFNSEEVSIKASVKALPVLYLGGDLWSSESYGLMFSSEIGLGAKLELPFLNDDQTLSYNHSHTLIGGKYRWHFTERDASPALDLGLGLRWQTENVPKQKPTYFVDRLTLGPALMLGMQFPFGDNSAVNLGAAYSRHLLIREDPADSGEPVSNSAVTAYTQLNLGLTELLGLMFQGHYRRDQIDFNGFGTRASGVRNGQAVRNFWGISIGVSLSIK